ncbi:hypothetical protein Apa02nite_067500 [Actinoplanes palleronii]|uniref:Uncharacterized protein n=1 Tax=Actinoplanes palleronii TaxID=113570 RepID=A0ABQ4BIY0_9ACTN|nr:hypothetical protein Apa02nite_067500 [Actinoplanes palleronii]
MQGHGVAPYIAAEEPRGPGAGALQSQQDSDRGGLTGSVGAEEPGDLPGANHQIEAVERFDGTEGLM